MIFSKQSRTWRGLHSDGLGSAKVCHPQTNQSLCARIAASCKEYISSDLNRRCVQNFAVLSFSYSLPLCILKRIRDEDDCADSTASQCRVFASGCHVAGS